MGTTSSISFLLAMEDMEYLLHLQARAPTTTRKRRTAVPVPASISICWRLAAVFSARLTSTESKGLLTRDVPEGSLEGITEDADV